MPVKPVRLAITLCVLSVCITLLKCRAEKNQQKPVAASFEALIKSKLGTPYTVSNNTSQTFALCQQAHAGDHPLRVLRFIVVRLSDNTIFKEGSFRMGHVRWHDENSIEVLSSSSLENEDAQKKIIDIHAGHH